MDDVLAALPRIAQLLPRLPRVPERPPPPLRPFPAAAVDGAGPASGCSRCYPAGPGLGGAVAGPHPATAGRPGAQSALSQIRKGRLCQRLIQQRTLVPKRLLLIPLPLQRLSKEERMGISQTECTSRNSFVGTASGH